MDRSVDLVELSLGTGVKTVYYLSPSVFPPVVIDVVMGSRGRSRS